MRLLIVLVFVGILQSCSDTPQTGDASALDPNFFNLTKFVAQQQARLKGTPMTKSVSVNEISETHEVDEVDWELELAPFAQSDIDRPALWDKYAVDITKPCEGRVLIEYNSLDSSNFTKLLSVLCRDVESPFENVEAIKIVNGFDSYIAKTGQKLVWWTDGYDINSTQEAILSDERTLEISSLWGDNEIDPCVAEMLD